MLNWRTYLLLACLFGGCKKAAPPLFQLLPPAHTGIDFANHLSEGDSLNILNYIYYYNGGGVGIADFNGDGLEDLFFTGNEVSCRLYLNKGNLQFEDVTAAAGLTTTAWCTGVAIADINADGLPDLFVCTAGYPGDSLRKDLLFINEGPASESPQSHAAGGLTIPRFKEAAAEYGLTSTAYTTHAAFFDYDGDGDLDLYLLNHDNKRETLNTPLPKKLNGEGDNNDQLFRNEGGNFFTNVTQEAGILAEGYGLGIAVSDFNGDGKPDVYISNDFISNDLLYINEKQGHFTNQIPDYLRHQTYNSMGCDVADFNNDALPDIVTVDMLPETDAGRKMMAGAMTWDKWQLIERAGYEPQYMRNTLQLARLRQPLKFSEIGQLAGIQATDWSWAPLFADFDNDGWKDLFISNGYLRDITDRDFIDYSNHLSMFKSQEQADRDLLPQIRQLKGKVWPNRIFQNKGHLKFLPQNEAWGLSHPSCSNGAVFADLDNDGDLDLVINNLNEPAFIYENKADRLLKHNYLQVKLEGWPANSQGIGAALTIWVGGQKQYLEQYLSRGFMSSVTSRLHFGLGAAALVDSLEIRWPDGARQMLFGVPANQTFTLKHVDAKPSAPVTPSEEPTPLAEVTSQYGLAFKHRESPYNDFRYQRLLPHGFSENGPPLAIGDLNGDGLDDCYAGGGSMQTGRLFFQKPDGHFTQTELEKSDRASNVAALIFDANGDNFEDLLLTYRNNESDAGHLLPLCRLYLNDGKGNFTWAKEALPAIYSPLNCIAAADFDGDGDSDLFLGGDACTANYPFPCRSYLLRNDGGRFTDLTEASPALLHPGIVRAAQWADLDGDGRPELVVAGEWMPLSVYKNIGGTMKDHTIELGLGGTAGWWSALALHDLDSDGDLDIVAGNHGLNSRFAISEVKYLSIYAADFDQNGSAEGVLCRFIEGKEKPIHQRDKMIAQISELKKKFLRYAPYSTAAIEDIFEKPVLAAAYRRECRHLESAVFINEGARGFAMKTLPLEAQFAPVHALLCADFDGDDRPDILLAGNTFNFDVTTGRLDASNGLMLKGDGRGNFAALPPAKSGFYVEGVAMDMAFLQRKSNNPLLLIGVNNGELKSFEWQKPTKN